MKGLRTVVGVTAALVLVACSAGDTDGPVTVDAIVAATGSESARVRIEVSYALDLPASVSEGIIDFRSGDQRLVTGNDDDGGAVLLSVGDERFIGPRDPDDKGPSWVRVPKPREQQPVSAISVDPASLVDELRRSATTLSAGGSGRVRGEHTEKFKLRLESGSEVLRFVVVPPDTAADATMEIDSQARLRRLTVEPHSPDRSGDQPRTRLPIPESSTLELWDFGVDVDLDEPNSAEVVDFEDPLAGELMGRITAALEGGEWIDGADLDDVKLAGPFTQIASGAWEDVTWEVWEAPTTDGRVCHTFELDPSPAPDYLGDDDEALPGEIAHEGEPASCGPRADLFVRGDPVQLLGAWYADAKYWYFAGTVAPEISSIDVELRGGRVVRVDVDPASKVFALFSRRELHVKKVRPDAGSKEAIVCEMEGDEEFGAGLLNCSGDVRG